MTRGLGAFGEAWAAGHLSRHGYRIVERNVRYRTGEIDLVAEEGGDLVFVEVKCRRTSRYGSPEESLSPSRFLRLEAAIAEYLSRHEIDGKEYRVDVVAIEVDAAGRVSHARLLRGVERPAG